MTQSPAISFGTDGWRALIAEDFTFANVRACSIAVARYLHATGRATDGGVVGYDTRFASRQFAWAAARTLVKQGINPVTIADRPVPTPAASLGVVQRNRAIGIMITASHNPPEWNGFKVKSDKGGSASPSEVAQIESHLASAFVDAASMSDDSNDDAAIETADLNAPYINAISALVDIDAIRDAGIDIAVDSMHGSGAGIVPSALLGGTTSVAEIRSDVNPAFPGMKQPEPIRDNLPQLARAVTENRHDVGLATDGDADRLGVIDENGNYLTTLEVFSILFNHIKERRGTPGGAASTITMSSMVDDLAAHHGTENIRTPVGFKFVGPAMLDNACAIGGEESGGYAFAGHIPERDGPLSALMFLESMATTGKSPSQLLAEVHEITGPRFFNRIDTEFDPAQRDRIADALAQSVEPDRFGTDAISVDFTDGLRIEFADASWGVARLSGTEPLVRLYAESRTTQKRDEILGNLTQYLQV